MNPDAAPHAALAAAPHDALAAAPYAEFAAALLDPQRPPPAGLKTWNGSDPARRFAIYRNNVVVSLADALADTFPVLRRHVGEDFFAALARSYLRAQPPASPVLADYGDGFASWLTGFEPAQALPWLPDLARLERARVRACHAADAPALSPLALAARLGDPDALARARPLLHPALQVLSARHAVVTLWAAHQGPDEPAALDLDGPQSALVLRDPADEVLVLAVGAAEAGFVRGLQEGLPLAAAAAAAAVAAPQDSEPPFDLAVALARLIRHGQLVGWHDEETPA